MKSRPTFETQGFPRPDETGTSKRLARKYDLDILVGKAARTVERVRVYAADLRIDGDVDLAEAIPAGDAVIIKGSLKLTGCLWDRRDRPQGYLEVRGDLHASDAVLGGATVIVLGKTKITGTLFAHAEHGYARLRSSVSATLILKAHPNLDIEAPRRGTYLETWRDELAGVLHPDLLVGNRLAPGAVFARIEQGTPLLR